MTTTLKKSSSQKSVRSGSSSPREKVKAKVRILDIFGDRISLDDYLSDEDYNKVDTYISGLIKKSGINKLIKDFNKEYNKSFKDKKLTEIDLNVLIKDVIDVFENLNQELAILEKTSSWKKGFEIPTNEINKIYNICHDLVHIFIPKDNRMKRYLVFRKLLATDQINYAPYQHIADNQLEDFYGLLAYGTTDNANLRNYLNNAWEYSAIQSDTDISRLKQTYIFRGVNIDFRVPLSPRIVWKALMSPKFNLWFSRMEVQTHLKLSLIIITDVDMFGLTNVGFIKFTTKFIDDRVPHVIDAKTKKPTEPKKDNIQTGIVFMRGDAVGILILLHEVDKKKKIDQWHVILTCQTRIPAADENLLEIVAGMVDASTDDIVGVAAKEVEEETGIKINVKDTIDLGMMEPSMGGGDERIHLYAFIQEVTSKHIKEYEGRLTGNLAEGESITLKVVKYEEVSNYTDDAKAMCAMFRYEHFE